MNARHGVFAPTSRLRDKVVHRPTDEATAPSAETAVADEKCKPPSRSPMTSMVSSPMRQRKASTDPSAIPSCPTTVVPSAETAAAKVDAPAGVGTRAKPGGGGGGGGGGVAPMREATRTLNMRRLAVVLGGGQSPDPVARGRPCRRHRLWRRRRGQRPRGVATTSMGTGGVSSVRVPRRRRSRVNDVPPTWRRRL